MYEEILNSKVLKVDRNPSPSAAQPSPAQSRLNDIGFAKNSQSDRTGDLGR